jgi:hypothetical protein
VVVGNWIDQQLPDEARAALIADAQRRRGREIATGAVATHREPVSAAVKFAGMCGNPARGEHAVVEAFGILVLGRQAVIDRDHDATGAGA